MYFNANDNNNNKIETTMPAAISAIQNYPKDIYPQSQIW
jgi:hypothetical protein